ncbi:MAG: S8 family serine peptidase [Actinobacteria bacterium]|nr:S8 family serine peptidase [Actinomycetota bacterium]
MLRRMLPILCASLFTASIATVSSVSSLQAAPRTTARYVVTFRAGSVPDKEAGEARSKGWRVRDVYHHAVSGMAVDLTADEVAALAADPNVATIEPDVTMQASVDQSGADWGLDRIDQRTLPLSGTYSYPSSAGAGVKVYVIDTGVRSTHRELAGRVLPGYTLIEDGGGTEDCNGHGTHVAATIAGTTYGVAKAASIVPIRVLDCLGSGSLSAIIAGLDWVLTFNAGAPAVVNMSLGGGSSFTVDVAVQRVIDSGVPVVVAAGNSNVDACATSPARVVGAITVGAIASDDSRATYSNFGTCLDIFAPGTAVTSAGVTSDTATAVKSGTSMAAPHVAGVVALMKSATPSLTPASAARALAANATPGVVTNPGTGSPNRLLFASTTTTAPPPPPPPTSAAPGAFNKTSPSNGTTGQRTSLTLKWNASANATGYQLCLDTVNNNACDATWTNLGNVQSFTLNGLQSKRTYYWQIRATNAGGTTNANASTFWRFTTR